MIEEENLIKIVDSVKEKKQISDLENSFIINRIKFVINRNQEIFRKINFNHIKLEKDKNFKEIVKRVREDIGILYGSFLTQKYLKKDKLTSQIELIEIHKSTRERIEYYDEIYSKILLWYKPKKIADLACGMNPLSYSYLLNLYSKKISFFVSDLNPSDMKFIQDFFISNEISGVSKTYDITTLEFLQDKNFIDCDLLFLFKALDSFEHIKRNISKEILEKVPMQKIVVSFPKKSLVKGSDFDLKKRNWLFKFIHKMNWNYETFEVENELFILISKG